MTALFEFVLWSSPYVMGLGLATSAAMLAYVVVARRSPRGRKA